VCDQVAKTIMGCIDRSAMLLHDVRETGRCTSDASGYMIIIIIVQ
jgi:hypothetical protein